MTEGISNPWVSIIGLGEDGLAGLSEASLAALENANLVFGGARHLQLANVLTRGRAWPIPFSIDPLLAARGQKVAALVSGDPFWFGAGTVLAERLQPHEWTAFPAPGTFSLCAARLGWPIERIKCLGLHAASSLAPLIRALAPGRRLVCLIRDGAQAQKIAQELFARGFGESVVHAMERLGGPNERIRQSRAKDFAFEDLQAPLALAIETAEAAQGHRPPPCAPGWPDSAFVHDGQITKQAARALALSALAPFAGALLWDIGAGCGSISVEWSFLSGGPSIAIEARPDRLAHIAANSKKFALEDLMTIVAGRAPKVLADLPKPDAVFIGGGADADMLEAVWRIIPAGTRLVANAVALETQALLSDWSARVGGALLRIDLARAAPLAASEKGLRAWTPARPLMQWNITR